MNILVTGSTGTIGSLVVQGLEEQGASVHALTRNPDKASLPAGVTAVKGDMTDIPSMRAALKQVDTLFLLNAVVADEVTQAIGTLSLAREAGIERIVYLSVLNSDKYTDVPHFTGKYTVERMIEQFDLPVTVLRPSYFMQNDAALKDGLLQGRYGMPVGNVGVAMVDVRDIAEIFPLVHLIDGLTGALVKGTSLVDNVGDLAVFDPLFYGRTRVASQSDFIASLLVKKPRDFRQGRLHRTVAHELDCAGVACRGG